MGAAGGAIKARPRRQEWLPARYDCPPATFGWSA